MSDNFFSKLKNIKGIYFIVIALICGIILIIIGSSSEGKSKKDTAENNNDFISEYTQKCENDIVNLLSGMKGVSNVRVMLTLDCGMEYVYAENTVLSDSSESREYFTISDSSKNEDVVLLKQITPVIRGIAIVCEGGNDITIQNKIIEMLKSVYNIPSNRIFVSE